jgi:hypothetical protein
LIYWCFGLVDDDELVTWLLGLSVYIYIYIYIVKLVNDQLKGLVVGESWLIRRLGIVMLMIGTL